MWCHSSASPGQNSWCRVPDHLTARDSGEFCWSTALVWSLNRAFISTQSALRELLESPAAVLLTLWEHRTSQQVLGDSFKSAGLTWTETPASPQQPWMIWGWTGWEDENKCKGSVSGEQGINILLCSWSIELEASFLPPFHEQGHLLLDQIALSVMLKQKWVNHWSIDWEARALTASYCLENQNNNKPATTIPKYSIN